jgi:hypothetical protein
MRVGKRALSTIGAAAAAAALAITALTGQPAATAHGNRLPASVTLPDGFQPEGIASGPGTTFYSGSRANGAIVRGDLRTGKVRTLVAGATGRAALGMQYDRRTGLLWVAGGGTGTVTAYVAATGRQVARYAVEGSGFLNDLVITSKAVYVTDSQVARLVVVPLRGWGSPPPARDVTTLPLTGDLVYTAGFNANGIRQLPTGDLVLVQSSTGDLFAVDRRTGVTDRMAIAGQDLTGGDGLGIVGDILYVVRGLGGTPDVPTQQVVAIELGRDGDSGTIVGTLLAPTLDVPTTVTFAADRLWAVNGRFSTPATPATDYWVTQLRSIR